MGTRVADLPSESYDVARQTRPKHVLTLQVWILGESMESACAGALVHVHACGCVSKCAARYNKRDLQVSIWPYVTYIWTPGWYVHAVAIWTIGPLSSFAYAKKCGLLTIPYQIHIRERAGKLTSKRTSTNCGTSRFIRSNISQKMQSSRYSYSTLLFHLDKVCDVGASALGVCKWDRISAR